MTWLVLPHFYFLYLSPVPVIVSVSLCLMIYALHSFLLLFHSLVFFFFIFRPSFCFILLVVLPLICVSFSQFDPLFF